MNIYDTHVLSHIAASYDTRVLNIPLTSDFIIVAMYDISMLLASLVVYHAQSYPISK